MKRAAERDAEPLSYPGRLPESSPGRIATFRRKNREPVPTFRTRRFPSRARWRSGAFWCVRVRSGLGEARDLLCSQATSGGAIGSSVPSRAATFIRKLNRGIVRKLRKLIPCRCSLKKLPPSRA
jgi:hypothetical protein